MEITNVVQFVSFFPEGTVRRSTNQFNSPCPFCTEGKLAGVKNGIEFRGEDRLVWWIHENRFRCRVCARTGRGRNGVYFPRDLGQRFGVAVATTLTIAPPQEAPEKPLSMLWTEQEVVVAHARVDRSFWYRYGWDDETINYFRLGKGEVYRVDGEVNTIPMRVQKPFQNPTNGYVIATRAIGQGSKKHTPGSLRNYLWMIERYPEDKTIAIAEGEKDAISLSMLGYNVATHLVGASSWTDDKTLFIKALGYERILVFGDNNEAGRSFNRQIAEICQRFGIHVEVMDWDESDADDLQPDDDITEVLIRRGKEATRAFLDATLSEPPRIISRLKGAAIGDYSIIDPNYDPDADVEITSLEDVRGRGPKSIYHNVRTFLDDYPYRERRRQGQIKIVAVGPGAGKTHTLVQIAEEEAKAQHEINLVKLAEIREQIVQWETMYAEETDPDLRERYAAELTKARRKEAEFSFTSVSWFGQYKDGWHDLLAAGADEKLWYNFEARNADNCQDFETVCQLSARNHDVGTYCKLGCPFRDQCTRSGYLAQEIESRRYPIVFYRHQHLRMRDAVYKKNLIVIDENPSSLMDSSPIRFTANHVLTANPGWETEPEDREAVDAILLFANAVANTMKLHGDTEPYIQQPDSRERLVNPEYTLFGNKLFSKIDEQVRGLSKGEHTLQTVMEAIDAQILDRLYQPNYVGGDRGIKLLPRCVPQLYRAMSLELGDYVAYPNAERSSLIFLVGDTMEVYPAERIKVPAYTPIVLLDATASIPAIYEAMFNRTAAEIYAPTIRNPNAQTTVITGSDWTLSQIKQAIGKQLQDRRRQVSKAITTMTGEVVDLSEFPVSDELYNANIVKDALTIIKGLAESHKSIMIVTHKTWREPLESTMKGAYPDLYYGDNPKMQRMAFGHFGALRGTNDFKDYEAIALIGMFRIPYDVVYRRAQVWMRHIDPTLYEAIDPQTTIKIKPYHGQKRGHGYRTFDHWLADALVCQIEEGEMIQCIERIRPHATSDKKYIYVLANRPFARFVNRFVGKRDLVNNLANTRYMGVKNDLQAAHAAGRELPTIRELSKKHHLSMRDVAKIRSEFLSQVGNSAVVESVIIQ